MPWAKGNKLAKTNGGGRKLQRDEEIFFQIVDKNTPKAIEFCAEVVRKAKGFITNGEWRRDGLKAAQIIISKASERSIVQGMSGISINLLVYGESDRLQQSLQQLASRAASITNTSASSQIQDDSMASQG